MRRLRILTWHVHGSYLYYLSHVPHDLFVPVAAGRPPGYVGLPAGGFPWPANLHEVPAEELGRLSIDCLLYQSRPQWEVDRFQLLTPAQRRLPRIYLEHDPPREHPTGTRHFVDDPETLLVHVTPFNDLMWDSGRTPTRVIDHGVVVPPDVGYSGEIDRAVAVVNHIRSRGRRLGADLFEAVRAEVPVDLIGMGSREIGGLGEVPHRDLCAVVARYRVFFNPIRYTSLGLAVCEAMMLGLPVVGLATTEMPTVIENGVSGYVDTDLHRVKVALRELLYDPALARRMGERARRYARERFAIDRFVDDWNDALSLVTGVGLDRAAARPAELEAAEVLS
jgi:glycosyltransferase involved in cell wall biosynthesis